MAESLARRVRSSISWTAADTILDQVIALGQTVIVARLLAPDDFGLFAMAVTITRALRVLTNMGLSGSLIANKFSSDAEVSAQLDTVWTAELGRRLILTLLLLASVYPTAHFYGDNRLYAILPMVSLTPLVQGFQNIGLVLFRKEVRFARIVWYQQTSHILSAIVAVGFALWFRNVWALVLSQLISTVLSVFLSYAFYSYRPRFAFDRSAFARAFNFGKYMFVIVVMTYITTTADNIFLGKLFGSSVLGPYVVAYSLANIPVNIIYAILSNVMFPAYAELRERGLERLGRAFERVFVISSTLLIIMAVPLFILAEEIIRFLYGSKWDAAGPVLRILSLQGLCRGLVHIISPLLLGMNRPEQEAKGKVFEAIIFLSILYPLTANFRVDGAAWAGVIVYFTAFLIRFWFLRTLFPGAYRKILWILSMALLASVCGAISGTLVLIAIGANLPRIIVGGSVSIIVMVMVMLWVKPDLRREVMTNLALLHRIPTKRETL